MDVPRILRKTIFLVGGENFFVGGTKNFFSNFAKPSGFMHVSEDSKKKIFCGGNNFFLLGGNNFFSCL